MLDTHTNTRTHTIMQHASLPTPADPDALTASESEALDALLRRVAIRMASGIHMPETILQDEGLDPEDFTHIQTFPAYHQYYAEAHDHWNKRVPLEKRIKMRAAASLQKVVDSMSDLATNRLAAGPSRVQAANFLADLAGLSPKAQTATGATTGVAVSVNIDLSSGNSSKKLVLEATPVAGHEESEPENTIPAELEEWDGTQ